MVLHVVGISRGGGIPIQQTTFAESTRRTIAQSESDGSGSWQFIVAGKRRGGRGEGKKGEGGGGEAAVG